MEYDLDSKDGGGAVQALVTAPITIPLMLIALILIMIGAFRLSSGAYIGGFSMFLMGGVMIYISKIMMGS